MSIEIPGWLKWVGDLIGEDFPEGDEDRVWQQAQRWKDFADQLESQKSALEDASRITLTGFAEGQAHNAMRTEFQTLTSGDASLDVLVQQLRDLSDAVDKTGTEIEFAKEMYIANLAILAATLIALAASAWINWGAPAEGAAAVAATEFTISQLIRAAIAKVIEAGASKIVTELALRALQGAAINAIVSGGLNAGVQGLQMLQGHRHEFDGASLGNDIKGGLLAGAIAGPLLHGARLVDAGSPLGNQLKTFGASFAANTTGNVASQYALTGHVNFGDATMSGLIFGGIDGAHPNAARVPQLSGESTLGRIGTDRAAFGGDESMVTTSRDIAGDAAAESTNPGTRSAAVAEVDRPLNLGTPEGHSAPVSESSVPAHSPSTAGGHSGAPGATPRAPEGGPATPTGRTEAPAPSASPSTSANPAPPAAKSGLSPASTGHSGAVGEPAARVAESAAPRASAADPTTRADAVPLSGTRAEDNATQTADTGARHDSTPERHDQTGPDPDHPGHRWQDAPSHDDPSHSRATADDALSHRIPPVEPEAIRAPHGLRDQALARAHDNADWWHGLSGDEQRALIDTYPRDIGNAEGIPAAARHEANTHSIAQDRDQLRSRQESGERLTRAEQKYLNRLDKVDDALQEARRTAEEAGVGGPYVMAFDPHAFGGDGRAVVAFGDDPYRADSVSWHVPGLTTTIDSLGTNMTNALNHLQSTHLERPGISASSIAWIGYDAPSGLASWRVAFHGLAHEGGAILHSDIAGFNAARDAAAGDGSHFTNNHVFGHSYGSTTTSYAGEAGRLHDQVTTVTLLGSPGAGPHHSAEGFGIGENVYVASSSRDWVTTLGGRESGGRFLGRFGLGRDPAMDTWGGHRITSEFPADMDTAGTVGTHTAYYHYVEDPSGSHPGIRSESLANFGRIAAGHPERLDTEAHRHDAGRSGWLPGLRTEEPASGRPLRLEEGGSGREYSVDRRAFDPRWHPGEDGAAAGPAHSTPNPHDAGPSHASDATDHPAGSAEVVAPHDYPADHVSHRLGLPGYHPSSLNSFDTRTVYLTGEQRMQALHEGLLARGVDLETRAHAMYEARNELRSWARELMADRAAAERLNGADKSLTWDDVLAKYAARGAEGDAVYERIIESATRSRPGVNSELGIDPANPPALPPIHDGHDAYSDTGGVPISRDTFDEIIATEKGHRPDPETYLPPEYIADHLRHFDGGASRILIRSAFEEYGIGKPDVGRSEFVLTPETAADIVAEAGGDPIRMAHKLGIPEDQLAGDSIVVVQFHPSEGYNSHMPSGNEWGANKEWLPGGRLPQGDLEAVVHTDGMIKGRDYTVIDLVTGEVL